jgi:hypothetical protein
MTNQPRTPPDHALSSPPRCVRRKPWLFLAVAALVTIFVVSGELWAIRQAPPAEGAVSSALASDVDRALARVAAASLLIGPAD